MLNGEVSKNDYPFAAAKEQPFNGLWAQPEEGLVVYDWEAKQGALLDEDYSYSVDRMKGKIFNLAPVNNGWAVIGRADKYIGGCTFSIARCSEESIELTLDESGPLVVYHKARKPEASEGTVAELGNGFYRIDLPVGELDKKITLSL